MDGDSGSQQPYFMHAAPPLAPVERIGREKGDESEPRNLFDQDAGGALHAFIFAYAR